MDTSAERPVLFPCEGETLLGILHPGTAALGVVIVVGGPQYRAGSHRLFTRVARHLSALGHPVLRFDVRGMGDSSGALRSFEDISSDIGAAIDTLQAQMPQVREVMLWGLCDAASAILLYLHRHADARVRRLCLLNPWVRSQASLAQTHVKHYYLQRLMSASFWTKLLSGRVGLGAVAGLGRTVRTALDAARAPTQPGGGSDTQAPFPARMASACTHFPGEVLLVLSGNDLTAREFEETSRRDPAWRTAITRPAVRLAHVPGADHTFSAPACARALMDLSAGLTTDPVSASGPGLQPQPT